MSFQYPDERPAILDSHSEVSKDFIDQKARRKPDVQLQKSKSDILVCYTINRADIRSCRWYTIPEFQLAGARHEYKPFTSQFLYTKKNHTMSQKCFITQKLFVFWMTCIFGMAYNPRFQANQVWHNQLMKSCHTNNNVQWRSKRTSCPGLIRDWTGGELSTFWLILKLEDKFVSFDLKPKLEKDVNAFFDVQRLLLYK